jgi:hypothetical protein
VRLNRFLELKKVSLDTPNPTHRRKRNNMITFLLNQTFTFSIVKSPDNKWDSQGPKALEWGVGQAPRLF